MATLEKESSIVTLPMAIPEKTYLYLVIPLYLANLLKKYGIAKNVVLATNSLGQKFKDIDETSSRGQITKFQDELQTLGLSNDLLRNDNACKNELLELLKTLQEQGRITEENITVKTCQCGLSESLVDVVHYGGKKNLIKDDCCSQCHTNLEEKNVKGLVYHINPKSTYKTFPDKYQKYINDYGNNYSKILISKSRETGIDYNGYHIDIDFLRSMWLAHLDAYCNVSPSIVLTNPSCLYNTYIATNIYNTLTGDTPNILVYPYMGINNSLKGLKSDDFSLQHIIQNESSQLMQILMASGLKWGNDHPIIDYRSFKRSISRFPELPIPSNPGNITTLSDFLQQIKGNDVMNALTGKIGKKPIDPRRKDQILSSVLV